MTVGVSGKRYRCYIAWCCVTGSPHPFRISEHFAIGKAVAVRIDSRQLRAPDDVELPAFVDQKTVLYGQAEWIARVTAKGAHMTVL